MCWGVPARVLSVEGLMAKVDFGGTIKEVLILNEDISPGDLVVVHAGTIIGRIHEEEVEETLKLYGDLMMESLIGDGTDPKEAKNAVEDWIKKLLGEKDG